MTELCCVVGRISKGTRFSIPIMAMNKSKDFWGADAHEFKYVVA